MTGPLALSPLESLLRLSPLACLQALLCAFLSGELSDFYASLTTSPPPSLSPSASPPDQLSPRALAIALAGNGLLAFALNISSFSTNRRAGALTMTVCGNVKQCLTVLLGVAVFGVRVGALNGLGMVVALAGAAWYSAVELAGKRAKGGG